MGGLIVLPEKSQSKKILISLPDTLLCEIDDYIVNEQINRSEFVRRAMKGFLREQQLNGIREQLKKGYLEMGGINLSLAEMCFETDNETQQMYEEKLSESED
jgi:CopG family transcriptional regulator/antitoxin EndoAI